MSDQCSRFWPLDDTGLGGKSIWTCAGCGATRDEREKFLELEECQR